jgi:hypothetical protein
MHCVHVHRVGMHGMDEQGVIMHGKGVSEYSVDSMVFYVVGCPAWMFLVFKC